MNLNTKVSAGFRNVGDANAETVIVEDAPLNEVIRQLIRWIGDNSIAKRFDIMIGRDADYIKQKLNESRASKRIAVEDFEDEIAALMSRAPSDDPEDTWVPPSN